MNKTALTTSLLLVVFFCRFSLVFGQVTQTTIQPSNKDAYIMNTSPSYTNNGPEISCQVRRDSRGTYIRRSFIDFNLSAIPTNAIIVNAELKLYRTLGLSNPTIEVSRVIEDWEESGANDVNWSNQPNVSLSDAVVSSPSLSSGFHVFDIKDQVQNYVNYPNLNFGWRLKSNSESPGSYTCYDKYRNPYTCYYELGTSYGSNTYNTVFRRPILEVEWVLPIEIELLSITHSDDATSSNGSITVTVDKGDGTYSYQWIEGSTGNDIPGETSATISGLEPGWYGIEVTDGEGNVSYMAFVVGSICGVVQIDFQPDGRFVDQTTVGTGTDGNNMPYDDRNLSTTIVYRSERRLNTTHDFYFESLFRNRLIIPNNIKLISASQYYDGIYHVYNNGNESLIKNIDEEWQEEVTTWNTRPTYSNNILTIPTTTFSSQDVNLDLTDLYKDFQDGTSTNYGQSIVLNYPSSTTNRKMQFYNANYSTVSSRPKLTIQVGSPCNTVVKLSRKLDGNYYLTVNQQLFVEYNEPYQINDPSDIEYKILNQSGLDVSNGTALQNVSLNREVNVLSFDFSGNGNCLSTGYYTLEVYGPKGDKRVLRFYHENTGC